MPVLPPKDKLVTRRPSLRGVMMADISNGAERVRAWPRSRGRITNPKTKAQMEWFRQAQWATKYMAPEMQTLFMEATKGTPLLPRDIATMIFAGRFCCIELTDGRLIVSANTQRDVSESLDCLGYAEGLMLVRGPDLWESRPIVVANRAGCVLTRAASTAVTVAAGFVNVAWTAEVLDQLAYWAPAAPTQIVIPLQGWYQYKFYAERNNTNGNYCEIRVLSNGVQLDMMRYYLPNSYDDSFLNLQGLAFFNAGDIVTCQMRNYGTAGNFRNLKFSIVGNA